MAESYAEVLLPLPLEAYTYRIPEGMSVGVGCRVVAPLGKKRLYTGIVTDVHDRAPNYPTKEIISCTDLQPVVRRPQLRFWQWIASYYMCRTGDVCHAALPSGLLPSGNAWPFPKGAGYSPRTMQFVRLTEACRSEERLADVFEELKRAPKQETALLKFLDFSHAHNPAAAKEISKKELVESASVSSAVLEGLVKRGVLEYYDKEVPRSMPTTCRLHEPPTLSPSQQTAYGGILDAFIEHDVCLLHGVTSSGKTEIYIRLISDVLRKGRQALYLLPEIALTAQLTERLTKVFGDKLMVYHSKFSDNERAEVWNRMLRSGEPVVVLGVRSSVFLPFHDLGLVVIDEEHENTYKQQEHAPRYHARNAAIILSIMHGGKTLLGSATPSVESYYNARTGKYGFVQLNERYGGGLTPSFEIIDIAELRRKKIMKNALFSPPLEKHIREALSAGKQIILFQNRRGFAPVTECKSCGWTPHCPNCDVSLTYHRSRGHSRLECHYCGHNEPLPSVCPSCKGSDLQMFGFGTEKVEEETAGLFPAAKVDRLDLDSARSRTSYETILGNFAAGRTDILIGTQILSKGLDFGNVAVVGVLNADSLLNYPDFRSHERAFQLMTQVGGRAGRRESRGTVVVQTSQPNLPVIDMVRRGAYSEMVSMQLAERKAFRYPPFFRLITIVLRGKHEDVVEEAASVYADKLREKLGNARVLGPVIPPVTRVYNMHNRQVILKIEAAAALAPVRGLIEDVRLYVQEVMPVFKSLLIHFDVD